MPCRSLDRPQVTSHCVVTTMRAVIVLSALVLQLRPDQLAGLGEQGAVHILQAGLPHVMGQELTYSTPFLSAKAHISGVMGSWVLLSAHRLNCRQFPHASASRQCSSTRPSIWRGLG